MDVLLLGPLEVHDRGRRVSVPGSRPRALMALLALNPGRVMGAERLIELLWGDEAPATAANALQVHVNALRRVLEPQGAPYQLLVSERSGYVLKIGSEQLDYARFERLIDQGHQALERGEMARCVDLITQAIGQWRGSALADVVDQPWSISEARRLEELRLAAEEDRMEAELALGGDAELIPELQALLARAPLRERLSGQLMLALYRSGRQAEASEVYQATRERLVEELGMEPGLQLQGILKAILNHDASLAMPSRQRLSPRMDNLPSPLTSFVGRQREIFEVGGLLSHCRLATLTGPGGMGKTRLAIEVARHLLDNYEAGVWLISFGSIYDPDLVPLAVASGVGARSHGGQSPTDTLTAYLNDRRCLLIFDNCEHLIDACARLAESVIESCPQVTILATSREALDVPGEVVWPVPQLELQAPVHGTIAAPAADCEAVQLFQQRASTANRWLVFDARQIESATQICRTLDGIPLAIELAAARLKVLSLEELSVRVVDRFQLLRGGHRTDPPRHQTLRAAIDWSYELLPERERTMLRGLGVFSGSFTLEAAESVCQGTSPASGNILDDLSSLVRKSLVQVDRQDIETRYWLLDTIRDYCAEKLAQFDEALVVGRRHRDFYLDLAEQAAPQLRGPTATVWIARLARDHDNIRAAVQWSLRARDSNPFARLLAALWWFWYVRCFFDEGRRWLDIALTDLKPSSIAVRVPLLLGAGQLAWAQGDHGSGRAMFEEALSLTADLGDEAQSGQALLRLSLADYADGEMKLTQEHLIESIRLLRKHERIPLLAEALNNLGWLCTVEFNDLARGRELLVESLSLARQCGDQWTLLEVLDSLARFKMVQGDTDTAEALQEESLRTCIALGDAWTLPRILAGFVRLAMARGQLERALRLCGAAAKLRSEVGMVLMVAERAELDSLMDAARSALPAEVSDSAWNDGWRMTGSDMVNYALSQPPAATAAPLYSS